jgi:hypothetical protein
MAKTNRWVKRFVATGGVGRPSGIDASAVDGMMPGDMALARSRVRDAEPHGAVAKLIWRVLSRAGGGSEASVHTVSSSSSPTAPALAAKYTTL